MNNTHALELLKALIRSYFSEDLQSDESPAAALKRKQLREAILELSKN